MADILVTAKVNPDLDGTACMLAYADLLRQDGKSAEGIPFGSLSVETLFFVEQQHIKIDTQPNIAGGEWKEFILVDYSAVLTGLPAVVDPNRVIETIDHREPQSKNAFPKAKVINEPIGAAATYFVEKFARQGKLPTRDEAMLLYGAIFENTLNFLASNVDERDKQAVRFLESEFGFNQDLIAKMYQYSTAAIRRDMQKPLNDDSKIFEFPGGKFVMGQLAAWGITPKGNENVICEVLEKLQQQSRSNWSFLNLIDLKNRQNYLYAPSLEAQKILEKVFGVSFVENVAVMKPVLLRKQMYPMIKQFYE